MKISLNNNYKISFGGYNYYTTAVSKSHAKTKIYNQIKKTESSFVLNSLVNTIDMKVSSL